MQIYRMCWPDRVRAESGLEVRVYRFYIFKVGTLRKLTLKLEKRMQNRHEGG